MGGLLGGGGGGGTQAPTSTTTTQELSPEQKRLLKLVIPTAEQFIKSPPELFPGSAVQPFDPLQVQAQEDLLALSGSGGSLPSLVDTAGSGLEFLLGPVLFPESNPALAAATEAAIRPLSEQFQNVTLPGIRGEAITAGGFGGSRQGIAEGLAAQGLARQSGDVTASIQANAFQQSLDAMTRALFAAPATAGLQFLPTAATGAVGAQRQQLEQSLLSEEAQRFISEQLIPFATAQDVAALAFGIPGGSVTSTSQFGEAEGSSITRMIANAFLGPHTLGFLGAGPDFL